MLQILPCKKMSDVLSALVSENRILCGACECRWNYQRKLEKNEEGIDAVTGELSRIVKQFSLMLER